MADQIHAAFATQLHPQVGHDGNHRALQLSIATRFCLVIRSHSDVRKALMRLSTYLPYLKPFRIHCLPFSITNNMPQLYARRQLHRERGLSLPQRLCAAEQDEPPRNGVDPWRRVWRWSGEPGLELDYQGEWRLLYWSCNPISCASLSLSCFERCRESAVLSKVFSLVHSASCHRMRSCDTELSMQVYLIRHLPFNGSRTTLAFSVATRLG